jgi:hypothetical protein
VKTEGVEGPVEVPRNDNAETSDAANDVAADVPRLVFVAFAVLGLSIGLFVGMSESPVGATVVGALFTLVGSGGLLSMAVRRVRLRQFRQAAISVIGLCLFTIVGAFLGIGLREGFLLHPVSLWKQETLLDLRPYVTQVPRPQLLQLVLLQTELSNLRVSPAENNKIVNAFVQAVAKEGSEEGVGQSRVREIRQHMRELQASSRLAHRAADHIVRELGDDEPEDDEPRKGAPKRPAETVPALKEKIGRAELALKDVDRLLKEVNRSATDLYEAVQLSIQPELAIVLDTIVRYKGAKHTAAEGKDVSGFADPAYRSPRVSIKP